MEAREYLENLLHTRKEIDDWIAGKASPWKKGYIRYDGELGWLFRSGRFQDGVDGSTSTYNFDDLGPRRLISYRDKSCRINTYGDSFTECHQVSDGETWQEVLSAHLCEPIRNYGVGGYSVYQAYLRMMREEIKTPAEYIIFNIYDDDHYRNLNGLGKPSRPYVKVNPAKGEFVEFKNPYPTPESLYNQCDVDHVYETFRNDFVLKIRLILDCPHQDGENLQKILEDGIISENLKDSYDDIGDLASLDRPHRDGETLQKILENGNILENIKGCYDDIGDLASKHGIEASITSGEGLVKTASLLYDRAAIFASMRIVEKVEDFAAENGKKVLYVLSFRSGSLAKKVNEGCRFDQDFVDFLKSRQLPFIDLMEAHMAEFAKFNTSIEDYLQPYYIGHYTPLGNFFQAFAVKDRLVDMLEPKPISYRDDEEN